MIATVGPSEYEIEVPHRLGYYNLPDTIEYNFEIKKKNNLPTPEFGTLEQMDDPTIQALSITRNAIVAEIQEPNNGIFENQMNSLREIEGYGAFGRCEYPHPEEHGHVFFYEDGIDCLISEMGRMIHKFNDIGAPEWPIPSHPQQIQQGFTINDIICKSDFSLMEKIDGSPICVKEKSVEKLTERGFAKLFEK